MHACVSLAHVYVWNWIEEPGEGRIVSMLVHYRKQWLCRVSQALGKAHKTLGKQHTASTVSANVYLSSVFYWALGSISRANNFKVNVTYILLLWLRVCIHTLHFVNCDLSNSTICMQACSTAAGVCVSDISIYVAHQQARVCACIYNKRTSSY